MLYPRFNEKQQDFGLPRGPQSVLSDSVVPLTTIEPPTFEPLELSDDFVQALRSRERGQIASARELAEERARQARIASEGALLQMAPNAAMRILTGVDVSSPQARAMMEFSATQTQKALEARAKQGELERLLPGETDLQLATAQSELDQANQTAQQQLDRDVFRHQANLGTQTAIQDLIGDRQERMQDLRGQQQIDLLEKQQELKENAPPSYSDITGRINAEANRLNAMSRSTGEAVQEFARLENKIDEELIRKKADLAENPGEDNGRLLRMEVRALEQSKRDIRKRRRLKEALPNVDFDVPERDDLGAAGFAVAEGTLDMQDAVHLAGTLFQQGDLSHEELVRYLSKLNEVDARRR